MSKMLTVLASVCLVLAASAGVQAATLTVGSDADTYIPNNDTAVHGDARIHVSSRHTQFRRLPAVRSGRTERHRRSRARR